MRQFWIAAVSAALALGTLACGTPDSTPVDSGTPGGGGGGGGGGGNDAGVKANATRSDAGFDFEVAGGGYLIAGGNYTGFLVQNAADKDVICKGGIPAERYAYASVFSPSALPTGTFGPIPDAGSNAYVEFGDSATWNYDREAATVTVTRATADNFAGTFEATSFTDEEDVSFPAFGAGSFDVDACPSFTGTGANTANGPLGFAITHALLVGPDADGIMSVVLSEADVSAEVCAGEDPTGRAVRVSYLPDDPATPAGTYVADFSDGAVELLNLTGAALPPMESYDGVITVTAGSATAATGTYDVQVFSDLALAMPISGAFDATACVQ